MKRIRTTDDFPIKDGYWYVVYLKDLVNIRLYPVYFINKRAAKRAITYNIPVNKRGKYEVHGHQRLKEFQIKYHISLGKLAKFSKYPDINWEMTPQQRKNHRTIFRRRLRRMGMLIPKQHKIPIFNSPRQARLLKNRQKVAMSPGTDARAFRLERKPKHYYYIIITKERSKKKRVMFEVKAYKLNSKTGELKKLLIQIYNRDVIIPHLLSEVITISKQKGYDKATEKIDQLYQRKYKSVQPRNVQELG